MIYFDEQAVTSAPPNCLNKSLWERYAPSPSPGADEDTLLKLRFLTKDQDGGIHPTVTGLLMSCDKPHAYLHSAYIQAVAYRDTDRNAAGQYDAHDIAGPLDKQIFDACAFVKKNMRIYATKNPARQDFPQYSMQAVFEAVVNAAAHRDYSIAASKIRLHLFSDRLEIISPGAMPNTMTIETMPLRQATRNELLTGMLARSPATSLSAETPRQYLMDRRGEGVPIILTQSNRVSGRMPEYQLLDNSELMLTIYAAPMPQPTADLY
jgi:predicted HTH transcriptional regulator